MTALALGGRESHLMGMKEGSLAMLITSITKNDKGQVIDVTESIYPGAEQVCMETEAVGHQI